MSELQLMTEYYVVPTPAGAYYAISSNHSDPARQLLFSLLSKPKSRYLTLEKLKKLSNIADEQDALSLLHRSQKLGWLQGFDDKQHSPKGRLEEVAPPLLAALCGSGKALLADEEGFYLATHGFAHEAAEEISALSADLASLHQRHTGLLQNNLSMASSAWAVVNAGGDSELGFWPLYIGEQRFSLVISGLPTLNQPAFMQLIWFLSERYIQKN
ncbi:MAG: hypothetical protein L3J62_08585 [Gammaproteobacteria bacterium]|nr:hypothetical protein [Gammaproteobacteria bacterium]MCF6230831.1 hypothetical protein [Gammaproteobacteria bacterium]